MVAEAHARNLEFHAWFNPYRVADRTPTSTSWPPTTRRRRHPDWAVAYGGKLYYNPGIPEVRAFVPGRHDGRRHAATTSTRVHFDDYFYPYPVSRAGLPRRGHLRPVRRAASPPRRLAAQQRQPAGRARCSGGSTRPSRGSKFGISPFGIWRNAGHRPARLATPPASSPTTPSTPTPARWVKQGWIDYIAPQIYWHIGHAAGRLRGAGPLVVRAWSRAPTCSCSSARPPTGRAPPGRTPPGRTRPS